MVYEVLYVEGIEEDFAELRLKDCEILSIKDRLKSIAGQPRPALHTERVINTPLRKIPYKSCRIFIYISEPTAVIYVLAVRHHNKCYKEQELRKVLSILKRIGESETGRG